MFEDCLVPRNVVGTVAQIALRGEACGDVIGFPCALVIGAVARVAVRGEGPVHPSVGVTANAVDRQARLKEAPPTYADEVNREEYVKILEEEMRQAAEALDFERAALLRDQLFELKAFILVQRSISKPFLVLARHAHREVIKLFTLLIHFREHSCRRSQIRIRNLGTLALQSIAVVMYRGIFVEQIAAG